jgi:putative membrane protein
VTEPGTDVIRLADGERAAARPPVDLRVLQANERTLLAWIRTSIALMAFGFVVARFGVFLAEMRPRETPAPATSLASVWLGAAFVLLGTVMQVISAARYVRTRNAILAGRSIVPGGHTVVVLAGAIAIIGAALASYVLLR